MIIDLSAGARVVRARVPHTTQLALCFPPGRVGQGKEVFFLREAHDRSEACFPGVASTPSCHSNATRCLISARLYRGFRSLACRTQPGVTEEVGGSRTSVRVKLVGGGDININGDLLPGNDVG